MHQNIEKVVVYNTFVINPAGSKYPCCRITLRAYRSMLYESCVCFCALRAEMLWNGAREARRSLRIIKNVICSVTKDSQFLMKFERLIFLHF